MPRFSLLNLFEGMTLAALVIGLAVHAPIILFISAILLSPLFFVAFMATRHNQKGNTEVGCLILFVLAVLAAFLFSLF